LAESPAKNPGYRKSPGGLLCRVRYSRKFIRFKAD